jgi:hypothetical protein
MNRRFLPRLLVLIVLFVLLICGSLLFSLIFTSSNESRPSSSPYNHISITFVPPASYEQALNAITNLGLQPSIVCRINSVQESQKSLRLWQPLGQKDIFLNKHLLTVESSAYTPSDWMQRLRTSIGVRDIKVLTYLQPLCTPSQITHDTPTPQVAVPLSGSEGTTYARISFVSPLSTYNSALYAISNLGLLLADPCYKQAQEQADQHAITFPWNSKPSWHSMSQEHNFNASHELIIETSPTNTSTLWQSQLQALPGVFEVNIVQKSCT